MGFFRRLLVAIILDFSMLWLKTCLIQTLIIVSFLLVGAFIGLNVFGIILFFGSIFFFYRSINHPDFWLRRAFFICLTLGTAHLAVSRAFTIPQIRNIDPWLQILVDGLNWIASSGPWIGITLLVFSVVFAILEIVRMRRSETDKPLILSPNLQINRISENFDDESNSILISIDVSIINYTDNDFIMKRPRITYFSIWPISVDATLFEMKKSTEFPCSPVSIKIRNNSHTLFRLRAKISSILFKFNYPAKILNIINKSVLCRRRASFKSKLNSGIELVICDTDKL